MGLLNDDDPEGMTSLGDGLAVDFGSSGLHYYDGSVWNVIAGADVDGIEEWVHGLIIDMGAGGLWNYDDGNWNPIAMLDVDGCEPVDLH